MNKIDTSKITDPEAKRFINIFLTYRGINREFYQLVPEDKFDYRMTEKSDSPRESLIHQIEIERGYFLGATDGQGHQWGRTKDSTLKEKSKDELLKLLSEKDQRLIDFLAISENLIKTVTVKYSPTPINVLRFLWAMNDHEILHNGWNLALMDHLNIPRFPALKQIWGYGVKLNQVERF